VIAKSEVLAWVLNGSMVNSTLPGFNHQSSTHLFEYNSHSGWLQKTNTHKFDIKIIKNKKHSEFNSSWVLNGSTVNSTLHLVDRNPLKLE